MSTSGQDHDSTTPHPSAPGVTRVDLRTRSTPGTGTIGPGSATRRVRDALTTPGVRCLLLVLDESSDGLDDDTVLAVADASMPAVAAVLGPIDGHATALALAADLRVAAADATVRVEPLVGGTSVTLPGAVGEATARLLLLAPRAVTATEARRIGLVHEVHTADRVSNAATALAAAVADRAGRGAAVRRALSPEGAGTSVARAVENEARLRAVVDLHPQD